MFFPWKQTAQAIETETPPLKQSQIAQDVSGRGKQSPCRRLSVRPSVLPADPTCHLQGVRGGHGGILCGRRTIHVGFQAPRA